MGAGETVRGYVELLRPVNVVAASVLTFIGAYVAGGVLSDPLPTTAAVVATGLAVGAGNAINDYFDREIDRINRPDRAIPRGAVSPRGGLIFSIVLFAIAVGLALTLPILAIAIAAINLVALVAYTEVFKGLPGVGNALVAYLVGSTFVFGGAAVGSIGPAIVLAILAFVATFAREIVKDVEDIAGDRSEGLETLPIVIGEERSLLIATVAIVVAILASPIPYLLGYFGVVYLAIVIPANGLLLYGSYRSFESPAVGQAWLKYAMFLAVLAFVLGRATVDLAWSTIPSL